MPQPITSNSSLFASTFGSPQAPPRTRSNWKRSFLVFCGISTLAALAGTWTPVSMYYANKYVQDLLAANPGCEYLLSDYDNVYEFFCPDGYLARQLTDLNNNVLFPSSIGIGLGAGLGATITTMLLLLGAYKLLTYICNIDTSETQPLLATRLSSATTRVPVVNIESQPSGDIDRSSSPELYLL